VYFLRGMDRANVALDEEQFEKLELALKRAREIHGTGGLVELFEDDIATPIMDFEQVSEWCRSTSG
jgi:hypothetical protein